MTSTCNVEDPRWNSHLDGERRPGWGFAVALILLGGIYVFSRSIGLDQSLWEDELYTAHYYVRGGLSAVFDPSAYIANNHVLYSLLGIGLTSVLGASEVVLRLGSVIPASVAGVVMAYWLWKRYGAVAGLSFVILVTLSPMHFDELRQARGWGLALLGATIVLVASLEMQRAVAIRWHHVLWFVAGALIGIWTVYALILPFAVQGLILLVTRHERARLMAGAGLVLLGSALFYWPLRTALVDPSAARSGPGIPTRDGFVTLRNMFLEPLDRLLVPMFELSFPRVIALVISGLLVVAGAVLLLRSRHLASLLQLLLPVVVTFIVLGVRETAIWDRYVSPLMFHVLALAALGVFMLWNLAKKPPFIRSAVGGVLLLTGLAVSIGFAEYARPIVALPRENFKGATAVIDGAEPLSAAFVTTSVFQFAFSSHGTLFTKVGLDEFYTQSCTQEGPAVFVDYPRRSERADTSCLESRAAKLAIPQRWEPEMNVWIIP